MPLSWVKAKYSDLKSQALGELATELEVEVSEDLVEALAAATSLVAFADGVASPEEREALLAVFEEEDRLTEIDLDDLFDAVDDYAERFTEDASRRRGRGADRGRRVRRRAGPRPARDPRRARGRHHRRRPQRGRGGRRSSACVTRWDLTSRT